MSFFCLCFAVDRRFDVRTLISVYIFLCVSECLWYDTAGGLS